MAVPTKKIKDRVTKMNTAWAQEAPAIRFQGVQQSRFQADIQAAATADQEIADIEAQLSIKRDGRDAKYQKLSDDSVKVRDGVEGDENFGIDHPLYEAMGFVRSSTRKSGLTRKKSKGSPTA